MPFCTYGLCENYIEGSTRFCATHNAMFRKEKKDAMKVKVVHPIRKISKKQAKELETYTILRTGYLKSHYYCEAKLQGCTHKAVDIHHTGGREGEKLTDISKFLAVCRECHSLLHDKLSAKERREKGLLK